jgi:hypothetical protein
VVRVVELCGKYGIKQREKRIIDKSGSNNAREKHKNVELFSCISAAICHILRCRNKEEQKEMNYKV